MPTVFSKEYKVTKEYKENNKIINKIALNSTNNYCKKITEEYNNKKNINPNMNSLIPYEKYVTPNNVLPILCFLSISSFFFYLYKKK
jgi:hypothetical protein